MMIGSSEARSVIPAKRMIRRTEAYSSSVRSKADQGGQFGPWTTQRHDGEGRRIIPRGVQQHLKYKCTGPSESVYRDRLKQYLIM